MDQNLAVDHTLDARGKERGDAFRAAREKLAEMAEEHILELFIDDGEALRTIPFALRADGHEILASEVAQRGVRLLVRKRSLIP